MGGPLTLSFSRSVGEGTCRCTASKDTDK